jgi:hypothetical protein
LTNIPAKKSNKRQATPENGDAVLTGAFIDITADLAARNRRANATGADVQISV